MKGIFRKRRHSLLVMTAATFSLVGAWFLLPNSAFAEEITVYKSPTCGCCSKWIDHLRDNGFKVKTTDLKDLRMIKSMSGVKPELASCHTALIDGYVIEGHVPADDIRRLLKERPEIAGLTAPGMPMGSPGMEGPRKDKYDVLTFQKDGRTAVFASH